MKLSFETLKTLSQKRKEPAWLFDQRKKSWDSFEALPLPTSKDEKWKYADIKGFNVGEFDVHERVLISNLEGLTPEFQQKGVIFCNIKTALKEYPSLVESIIHQAKQSCQKEPKDKFEHLHQAFWQDGIFIYIPKGVRLEKPLYSLTRLSHHEGVIFPFTLIVVEPFGKVSVIDEMTSKEKIEISKQFSDSSRYFWIKEEGELAYVNIQRWGEKVVHFETQYAHLEKGSRFSSVQVGLGSQLTKANIHTVLGGKEAKATLLGVFLGHGKQHFDYYTTQDHIMSETQSDLLFKSALKDFSQSSYQGVIHIPKQAQKSDAYQANKNLLLSSDAKARSIPKLEIIADDVRCTHSATVGTIDETETFYLQARGLTHEEAQKMIVQGFFEQVFQRIPSPEICEKLHNMVELKLKGGK